MFEIFPKEIFVSSHILTLIISESIILFICFFAFLQALQIYSKWNFKSLSETQYSLEKKSYFTTLAIYFVIFFKFLLFVFFANSMDKLSSIMPGAMCGAGVVSANDFGMFVFVFKLIVIFLSICWIAIHKADLKRDYNYLKKKYFLFFVIFAFLVLEFVVQMLYFSNLSFETVVQCCSVIYGSSEVGSTLPFGLSKFLFLILFFLIFVFLNFALFTNNNLFAFIFGILFFYFGYFFVIFILGIYIYELPTHICPFCMLQKEYFYVGYIVWLSLFMGSFFAISNFVLMLFIHEIHESNFKISLFFNFVLLAISIYFIFGYYLKNGVWL